MNLLEVVSEKFLGTNAAKVIANYPNHFVKLLIKKLEQEVGEVKGKVADKETTWRSEPIFKQDRRGKITAEFPKRRLDISIQPKVAVRAQWIPTYQISLELLPSMKLEISPTHELVDITRLTIGELINKVVDAAKETRVSRGTGRYEPEEIHLKSIRKIMTDHGLKLTASYYKGISDDEYDYSFEIYMMDDSPFKKKDTTEIYRVMPAIMKWHNANNMALERHGLCAGSDYYYLQSSRKREPHEKNSGVYRNLAETKPKIIGNLFSGEE